MVNAGFESALSEDEGERRLRQLAIQAKQHPPQSSRRQLALNRLANEILKSRRLSHPQRGLWPPDLYEDYYNEALQLTLLEICQKIDRYNPEHPVMAWVNALLKNRFFDVVEDYNRRGITYLAKTEREQTPYISSLEDLERYAAREEARSDGQLLQQFLEEDPENRLKDERLRNRPEVTFQFLALAKFVEDRSWTEIASDLNISVQTLCSFFNRRLQKLMPHFQKYLQE